MVMQLGVSHSAHSTARRAPDDLIEPWPSLHPDGGGEAAGESSRRTARGRTAPGRGHPRLRHPRPQRDGAIWV